MKEKSIWLEYVDEQKSEKLNENIDVDVLIIGGGITGVSVAYNLINSNLKVALVERNKVATGITSKSTAKVTYLQEAIYSKLKTLHNEKVSSLYLSSQMDAIDILKGIIEENNIDCKFSESDSYLFTNDVKNIKIIEKEEELLNKFQVKTKEASELPNGFKIVKGFKVENTYVFNPVKYVTSLKNICIAKGISVYENTNIIKINKEDDYYLCYTNENIIKAKKVVLALHYPYFLVPFLFPLKCRLEKSYIKAGEIKDKFDFNAISVDKKVKSIRYYSDNSKTYEIVLTASHNIALRNCEKKNFEELNDFKVKADYCWSNIDIITHDYLPFIGLIDEDIYLATGFNTWGMTNGVLSGKIISDIILKKDNKYIELFNPKRSLNLGKIVSFPLIVASNIYSFINSKVNIDKSWYESNIKFEERNGKKVAIFMDDALNQHIVYTTCPHLKCSLVFNEIEKTWDCPCHGSRFDIDGNCLNGPSKSDVCVEPYEKC